MYKRLFELEGRINTVEELNAALRDLTGDVEDWFDEDDESWRAWIEYEDGKTYVLAEEFNI